MNDSKALPLTLPSLGASRPRPRRNHKPSTPSALSPTYESLPSLFEDDQLAAFFPPVPSRATSLPDAPSSAPPTVLNTEFYRYPSPQDECFVAPDEGVEETREEGERLEAEDRRSETRREKKDEGRRKEEEERIEGMKERGEVAMNNEVEEEEKGRYACGEKEEEERNETKEEEKEEKRKEEGGVARYFNDDNEDGIVSTLDDATCADAPISKESVTEDHVDPSYNLSPSPVQPAESPHLRRPRYPTCSTPDSLPRSSYTTDDAAPTEIPSSPQSAPYEDEDVHFRFVFPPTFSRLGSIYSHLGLRLSRGDGSSSDSEGEARGSNRTAPKNASKGTSPAADIGKGDAPDSKHASTGEVAKGEEEEGEGEATKEEEEAPCAVLRSSQQSSSRSSTVSLKGHSQGSKKVAPPKPPRLRTSLRVRSNSDKRRSREDPVRYQPSDQEKQSPKRSASMTNILESNLEATNERCLELSQSPAEAAELTQPPAKPQEEKKDRRHRNSGSKYKDAAKIVTSIISKKPPFGQFLHRKEALKYKSASPKKMPCKEMEASPSAPPPPPAAAAAAAAAEEQRQEDVASPARQTLVKPPRKDLETLTSGCLDKTQEICAAHGALLHFYCVKCRVVVCRDCTVVAHSQGENHKVLDTLDSLATLRSEAVAMLRHYTILDTMHATLTEIHRKFMLQHRDTDIAAIEKRLDEGKYLAVVVKEAEHMMTTWTNLQRIQECVRQWEARQDEWSDLVFLASRCDLLTNMRFPLDTVLLRMGNWVMPTPWIQLSHLLLPYLRKPTASQASPSSPDAKDGQLTPDGHRKTLNLPSPLSIPKNRSGSPYGARTNTGGTDKPFPYNARQMVLSNLVPYIILNPDIRYFVHVGGPRDVELTLVVLPVDDHARDYLKRRRFNATKTPEVLRRPNYQAPVDAISLVEQQMTCGSCRTRITASSMPLGPSSASALVKVTFSDVKVVSDGNGLPAVKGGVKRGEVVIDLSSAGRPALTVVVRDIGDFPALRLGHVTWGMDGLICLVGSEDTKKAESGGFRAKIKASVKREEEAVYDVMFGLDL